MTINISANLKKLRKQREMTQEDLADFIGVSFQAVSKWERNEGYPDITILPVIANYFGVTLDELVGMDEMKNEVQKEETDKKKRELVSAGKIGEAIELLRESLKTFPNDFYFLAELACYLDGHGKTEEECRKNRDESIKISERILEFCTDSKIRSDVQANMCFTLWRSGEAERAVSVAETLPGLYKTKEVALASFLSGTEKTELCQTTIQKLCWIFWAQTKHLAQAGHYSVEEKLAIYKKAIAIYELVYDSGDLLYANVRVYDTYYKMAQLCADGNAFEEAIDYLEKAAEHAVAFSTLPEKQKYKSLLVNTLEYDRAGTSASSEKNTCWHMKNNMVNDNRFRGVLENNRVKAIIGRLESAAN